jgi:hypothetical protein
MRESTQVKHVLQSKGYSVLRVKYAYRERYLLVTLPTEQANRTPRLPGEILSRELAYNFHGRIPERMWLKVNGQMLLDNEYLIPRAEACV